MMGLTDACRQMASETDPKVDYVEQLKDAMQEGIQRNTMRLNTAKEMLMLLESSEDVRRFAHLSKAFMEQ